MYAVWALKWIFGGILKRYNTEQVFNWNHQENVKYRRCHICNRYGVFGINDRGAYYFVCGKHYGKETNKKTSKEENNLELF